MNNRRSLTLPKTIALSGLLLTCVNAAALADNHSWNVQEGDWSVSGNWSPGALPSSNDTISIGNTAAAENGRLYMDQDDIVAGVTITDGMVLRNWGNQLTVQGDTTISGNNVTPDNSWRSRLIIDRGVASDDFDTDVLSISDGAELTMFEGILEIDESFYLSSDSRIWASGVIDFEGNGGNVFSHNGFMQVGTEGLTLNQNGSGLIDLDGNTGNGRLHIAGGRIDHSAHDWLTVNGTELADDFSGELFMGHDNVLTMNLSSGGWTADANSEVSFVGSFSDTAPSRIEGSPVTMAGIVSVRGNARIAPHTTFAASADIEIGTDDNLMLPGGVDFQGASIFSDKSGPTITPDGDVSVSADTTVDMVSGVYDLDGDQGTAVTTVAPGVAFTLNVDSIEDEASNFDGRVHVGSEASFNVNTPVSWRNSGIIDLFNGSLTGAGVINVDTIRGSGTVEVASLDNSGTIQASDGGVLTLNSTGNYDLDGTSENGILQANNGSIVINGEPGFFTFNGTISIASIRSFTMTEGGLDNAGTIGLAGTYSGDLNQRGTLTTSGAFGAAIVSNDGRFDSAGTNTLGTSLRLAGNFYIESGAVFTGPGGLSVGQNSELVVEDGVNLDVDLTNRGLLGFESAGQLTVNNYVQTDSGTLEVRISDSNLGDHDQLVSQGTAELTGNLDVALLAGDTFEAYETAEIILAPGGIDGMFESVDGVVLNATEGLAVTYEATTVDVTRAILGDANLDGFVNGEDFLVWNDHKFTSGNTWATGDFTGDGLTDGEDFLHWNNNKFSSSDAAMLNAVPEPTLGAWLMIASLGLLRHRRRH